MVTEVIENKDVQYGDLSSVKLYQIKTEQIPETKVSPDRTTQERKGPAPVKCEYLHLILFFVDDQMCQLRSEGSV